MRGILRSLFLDSYLLLTPPPLPYPRTIYDGAQCRAVWYTAMKALRDGEEMQRKGIVVISYLLDGGYPKGGVDYEYVRRQNQNFDSIPAKVVALYFIVGNHSIWNRLVDFTTLVVSPLLRLRARAIRGEMLLPALDQPMILLVIIA